MKQVIGFLVMLLPALCTSQINTVSNKTSKKSSTTESPGNNDIENYAALGVGSLVPDIKINNIINYVTTTSVAAFKGKVVILDFFATWCGACIKELPHLDSLQKQMNDKVQILVVAYEPTAKVKSFLKAKRALRSVRLPFITADSIFSKMFPHVLIPHEVWIGTDGRVGAITAAHYVTAENVKQLFAANSIQLPLKKDIMDFDRSRPLLENGNGGDENNLLYRSVMTSYLNGVFTGAGETISKDSASKRTYYVNHSILALYLVALNFYEHANRIVLEVKDSTRYIQKTTDADAWNNQNMFCYEITAPCKTNKLQLNNMMLQDLNRYLGIYARLEKRLTDCYALVRLNKTTDLIKAKGGIKEMSWYNEESHMTLLKNQPITELINALNYQIPGRRLSPVIIDETNYAGNIDIQLKTSSSDLTSLQKELQHFGLDLLPVKRELEMLVITENGYSNFN